MGLIEKLLTKVPVFVKSFSIRPMFLYFLHMTRDLI